MLLLFTCSFFLSVLGMLMLIQVTPDVPLLNSKVLVQLPRELDAGPNNKIVFCMFKWPKMNEVINYIFLYNNM